MKKVILPGASFHILSTLVLLLAVEHIALAQRFEAATAYTVGTRAQNIFVADFNHDGKPDLLIIDNPGPSNDVATLEVMFGNGDGTFQPAISTPTITDFAVAAVGDFNGDGIPDVAVSTASEPGGVNNIGIITIFLGNGDGTFTATSQTLHTGDVPSVMEAVDFNGDGILDLLVANDGDNTVSVFTGKGDGSFSLTSTQSYSTGNIDSLLGLAIGDFNGDGKPDVVLSVDSPDALVVLKGNGDGTFQPPVTTPLTMAGAMIPGVIAATDFNGDGKLDVLFIGFTGMFLFPGNGDGTFQPPVLLNSNFSSGGLAIADMNGDGHPDLVDVSEFGLEILFNDGKGGIASSQTYGDSTSSAIAVADLNGDGHPDIALVHTLPITSNGPNNLQIILNNGDGTLDAALALDISGRAVVADFNNDGKPDLAIANGSSAGVLLNSGGFQFAASQPFVPAAVGSSTDMVAGDFDGDGNQDLVVVGSSVRGNLIIGSMAVLLGEGNGGFKTPTVNQLAAPTTLHRIAAGDFNGDGKLDVVVTNMDDSSTTVGVFLGNGDGTFQTPSLITAGSKLTGVAVGDFSGHGHLDIAVTNEGDGINPSTVSLLVGDGTGNFTLGTPVTVGVAPVALAAGDLNNDGKLDLVVANSGNGNPGSLSILMGNGDGTFQTPVSIPLTASLIAVTLGDFNGDGFPDIAVAERGSTIDLFTNNGDGTFPQVPERYATGGAPDFLIAVDLDNGGLPDLLLSSNMNILRNRGGAQISLTSSQNPSTPGQQVTFSATVVPNVPDVPVPTGTVQFSDGGSKLGTVTLSSAGTATFSTSTLTFGTHTIQASYSGDANFPARTFPNLSQVVLDPSSVQVTSSSNPSVFGTPVVISVNVTSTAAGTPSGNVSLLDGATAIASATLDGSAKASFTLSTLTGGTHNLTVSYAGDQTFIASVSNPPLSQVVNQAASSSSLASGLNPSTFSSTVTFTIHVSGVNATAPTGTVSLLDGATTLASTTVDGSGNATFNLATLGGGTHSLTANYAGDQNYAASTSAKLSQVVNPSASTSSISSDFNPVVYSENFSVATTVSGPGNVAPSGKVLLLDGGSMLASATLDATGSATFAIAGFGDPGEGLGAGTHNLTINYAGDQNFAGSVSPVLQEVIAKSNISVGLSQPPTPVLSGTSVPFTVGISPSAGGVPGTVSLLDGSTIIATGNVASSGFANFDISTLALGSHSITANYPGDANRNPGTSSVVSVTVFPVDFSISASTSAVTVNAGQSATATITIFSNPSFSNALTFSCSGLPALASCSFNPPAITPNATFQSTTLTVTTTGPSATLSFPPRRPGSVGSYAMATLFPACAGLLFFANRKRRRGALGGSAVCLLFLCLGLLSSCGGGSTAAAPSQPPPQTQTPAGASTVVITASGGVSHQVTLTLTVQN